MKSYLKTTAGVVLSATMATASYGATVNVGELQGFTGPLESMICLLYTSPSPRDGLLSRMPSSA